MMTQALTDRGTLARARRLSLNTYVPKNTYNQRLNKETVKIVLWLTTTSAKSQLSPPKTDYSLSLTTDRQADRQTDIQTHTLYTARRQGAPITINVVKIMLIYA